MQGVKTIFCCLAPRVFDSPRVHAPKTQTHPEQNAQCMCRGSQVLLLFYPRLLNDKGDWPHLGSPWHSHPVPPVSPWGAAAWARGWSHRVSVVNRGEGCAPPGSSCSPVETSCHRLFWFLWEIGFLFCLFMSTVHNLVIIKKTSYITGNTVCVDLMKSGLICESLVFAFGSDMSRIHCVNTDLNFIPPITM